MPLVIGGGCTLRASVSDAQEDARPVAELPEWVLAVARGESIRGTGIVVDHTRDEDVDSAARL